MYRLVNQHASKPSSCDLKHIENWHRINQPIGQQLGYPQCCIDAFCDLPPELLSKMTPTKNDEIRYKAGCINGEFSGFIPCLDHALQIKNNEIDIQSLVSNRDPNLKPFPQEK